MRAGPIQTCVERVARMSRSGVVVLVLLGGAALGLVRRRKED